MPQEIEPKSLSELTLDQLIALGRYYQHERARSRAYSPERTDKAIREELDKRITWPWEVGGEG